jgi:nucleoside-diphosphate-sugar epimerase
MSGKVIVFGATGKTGHQICLQLESKQIPYDVFVRKSSAKKIANSPSQIKTGDVLNAQAIEAAFENETYTDVIISLGSKDLKSANVRSVGTKNILAALKNSQEKPTIHIVSALGVGDSWSQLNWISKLFCKLFINKAMKDHGEQEMLVTKSSFPYHIIRPVGLQDGEPLGEVHVQNEGMMPGYSIKRAEVAAFLVNSLIDGKRGFSGICQKV